MKNSIQLHIKVIIYVDKMSKNTNITNELEKNLIQNIKNHVVSNNMEAKRYKCLLNFLTIYDAGSMPTDVIELSLTEKEILTKVQDSYKEHMSNIEVLNKQYQDIKKDNVLKANEKIEELFVNISNKNKIIMNNKLFHSLENKEFFLLGNFIDNIINNIEENNPDYTLTVIKPLSTTNLSKKTSLKILDKGDNDLLQIVGISYDSLHQFIYRKHNPIKNDLDDNTLETLLNPGNASEDLHIK